MPSIPQIADTLQHILTDVANAAAHTTGFVQRQRVLDGARFVQALVFGFLGTPAATTTDLTETAAVVAATLSVSGLSQRFTPAAAACLEHVLTVAVQHMLTTDPALTPLLDRFVAVYLADSTTVVLPDACADHWSGCGGDGPRAALKAQCRYELRQGQLVGPILQPGRAADRQFGLLPRPQPNSLWIADLGYWNLGDLHAAADERRFWVLRPNLQTAMYTDAGHRLDLLALLHAHPATVLDVPIQLGRRQRIACRLIAAPVLPEVCAERQQRLQEDAQAKGRTVSARRLALAAWTLVVTNVPPDQLTAAEALVLIRVRWQIELLFKLWKDVGLLDQTRAKRPIRVLTELYAKWLAQVVQHWLILTAPWAYPERSLVRAARVVQKHAVRVLVALHDRAQLLTVLRQLGQLVAQVTRVPTRRTRLNTYQQLHMGDDPGHTRAAPP